MVFVRAHALVIGVGSYSNEPKLNVPLTAEDAQEVAAVLGDPRYCGYPEQQVTLLHDARATREAILQALDDLAQIKESDTLLLFYSGHGEYGEDGYYLTTHETKLQERRVVAGSGVREGELLEKIKAIRAKRVFLIFNACHSGEVSPASLGVDDTEDIPSQSLPNKTAEALLGTGEGRVIITACRETQKSYYVRDAVMTIFAKAFTDGLRGGNILNRRGYISIFDLYEYVFNSVKTEVNQRFGQFGKVQEPELTIQKGIGAMAVALHRGKTPEGELGKEERPESLGGAVREVELADSRKALQQILSGEVNLAAARDIRDVTIVQGDKNEGDTINARGSKGFINKPSGTVRQHFGSQTTIHTGGGDYAGRDMYKSTVRSSPSPSPTVTLKEVYEQVQQRVREAEEQEQDELAEDLQQVEVSLRAAVMAEEKGKSSRRTSKLREAQQALQKMTGANPELKYLASLLQKVQ
ncbi:MAG: caspase family protein [Xenococcaceae cyanobacterium]